jgi:hypothetical protein
MHTSDAQADTLPDLPVRVTDQEHPVNLGVTRPLRLTR